MAPESATDVEMGLPSFLECPAGEGRAPKESDLVCGIDKRPWLPVVLVLSTVLFFAFFAWEPLWIFAGGFNKTYVTLLVLTSLVTFWTLAMMWYSAVSDPGQIEPCQLLDIDDEENLPPRAHKSWQYPRPVLRYDHYCRWTHNTIGLRNHRAFILMLMGLVAIALSGLCVDIGILIDVGQQCNSEGFDFNLLKRALFASSHMACCIYLLKILRPMALCHFRLITRNELNYEDVNNFHAVVPHSSMGENVPPSDLEENGLGHEYEPDTLVYYAPRNPYDKGIWHNCFSFWCTPRDGRDF